MVAEVIADRGLVFDEERGSVMCFTGTDSSFFLRRVNAVKGTCPTRPDREWPKVACEARAPNGSHGGWLYFGVIPPAFAMAPAQRKARGVGAKAT